ncbi:Protein of unknown function [Pyronema omphalodes CBS 100304]|uniref:Uncharacterized protein n=1 Tax=Pyronema omphalodes (strain CBS 100304) TaxID=1076935 RepID=U4LU04_PYROM|nr:Protein of unknown function [Pyronema omphalodes CBS 100304]
MIRYLYRRSLYHLLAGVASSQFLAPDAARCCQLRLSAASSTDSPTGSARKEAPNPTSGKGMLRQPLCQHLGDEHL